MDKFIDDSTKHKIHSIISNFQELFKIKLPSQNRRRGRNWRTHRRHNQERIQREKEEEQVKKGKNEKKLQKKIDEISDKEKKIQVEKALEIKKIRSKTAPIILKCLMAYRQNFEIEKTRLSRLFIDDEEEQSEIVNPANFCGGVDTLLGLETQKCFQGMFENYLEVVTISKVLLTSQRGQQQEGQAFQINSKFNKAVEGILTTIDAQCLPQSFEKSNPKCFQVFKEKLSLLKIKLQTIKASPAQRQYLSYSVGVVSQFWEPEDWQYTSAACTENIGDHIAEVEKVIGSNSQ